VGVGADDNGSGTAALLEVAQAMARAGPRRSVYFCAFAAEEDGLLGSAAFCEDPPLPASSMVAMVNMDMIGVGDSGEVVVLGLEQNPLLKVHLDRARKLSKTGVRRVRPIADRSLFRRSDHFSFHRIAVPTLFLFEGYPLEQNPDYHTWRDTLDKVDMEKVTRTARLAFNFAWILANADDRPPPPRE
jgi:Zn-dependent M28 family amino/carboxypeptidase